MLEAVADALREIVPHDTLTVYRADLPLRVLRPVLVRDKWAEEILAMGPMAFGQGITGWTAETRRAAAGPRGRPDDPRAIQIDGTPDEPESLITVPLVARDELKGVLCLYRLGEGNVFDERRVPPGDPVRRRWPPWRSTTRRSASGWRPRWSPTT